MMIQQLQNKANSSKSQGPTSPKKRSKLAYLWSSRERKKKISENTKEMENFQREVNKMLLQLQQQLLENCESQGCKCLQRIKKLAKNARNLSHTLSLSLSLLPRTLSRTKRRRLSFFYSTSLSFTLLVPQSFTYLLLLSIPRPFSCVHSFFFFFTVSLSFCT
jgi:hypothetical protein